MEHDFWRSRWDSGQIGFHRSEVNPVLLDHFPSLLAQVPPHESPRKVLVPLCGKSVDLTWLEQQGCEVLGIEFVEQAVREYFQSREVEPTVDGDRQTYQAGRVALVAGDFFAVEPARFGLVDLIYDRAALVAIAPERRSDYVARLASWLKPQGRVLLVSFEHDMGSGPPFSVPETEELLSRHFEFELLEDEDVLSHEPRFAERGATTFRQRVFSARHH